MLWLLMQVRGATTHYDAVVSAATSGCLNASTDTGKAVCSLLAHVSVHVHMSQLL